MLIFYYGKDTCRMRQAVHALADRYRGKHERTNLFLLDASLAPDRDELARTLKHRTFFREPTFTAASGVFDHEAASCLISELIEDPGVLADPDLVLLIHQEGDEPGLKKKNKALQKLLTSKAKKIQEFTPLKGHQLLSWMQAFCADRSCELPAPIASRLVALTGPDTWSLSNELAKICAWTGAGIIDARAVERLVVPPRPDADVFALTDAVASRKKKVILASLQAQLESGADPHYILSMYAFAVRNLLIIKDLAEQGMTQAAIAKTGGLHPFVVKKGMAGAQSYQKHELLNAHAWLSRADLATKDGSWDPRDSLFDFVLSVI